MDDKVEGSKPVEVKPAARVQWAPIKIPLYRRLQTLGALTWISIFLFLGPATILFFAVLLITDYYFISWLYLAYLVYDWNTPVSGGRRNEWIRSWSVWRWFRDYFPITMIKTAELPADNNYIFVCHPHGVLPAAAFACLSTNALDFYGTFPGLKPFLLTLRENYYVPGFREIFMASGATAATSDNIDSLLSRQGKGNVLGLIVGGAQEALNTREDEIELILKNRKGFIKKALVHGAHLVPVFTFGENEIYTQIPNPKGSWLRTIQDSFQHYFGLAPVLFLGRGVFQYNFGILPKRKYLYFVVGEPIQVEVNPNPTHEDVDLLHAEYTKQLMELYENNKMKYSRNPNIPLIIT